MANKRWKVKWPFSVCFRESVVGTRSIKAVWKEIVVGEVHFSRGRYRGSRIGDYSDINSL